MQTPLVEELGYLANTNFAEQVLADGTYQPSPTVDKYAIELLYKLCIPNSVPNHDLIPIIITPTKHTQGWIRTKEKSAEPSGPSMAKVKAASQDHILADIDTFMRNLPYTKGFSPRLRQLITDVEILEKAGVYDVKKISYNSVNACRFQYEQQKNGTRYDAISRRTQHPCTRTIW